MILHVVDRKYLASFVQIYNSAIELFPEDQRGDATEETFAPQLENDENYIEIQEDGQVSAFMSFHQYGNCYELTSLYIRREYQRKGIGRKLLCHFEQQVQDGGTVFVKVLKNAPWSLEFYCKNGYAPVDAERSEMAEAINIKEKPWSTVLYKNIMG